MTRQQREHTVLVTYATAHGSTAEIAETIANTLRDSGAHVRLAPVTADVDPGLFEVVILGGAIHNGEFLPEMVTYAARHRDTLRQRPVWLFSAGMGPALRGPIGGVLKRLTPPAVAAVQTDVRAVEYQPFAGVFERPAQRKLRAVIRLLGCRYGDQRDWAAITAWARSVADTVADTLPPVNLPTIEKAGTKDVLA